MAADARRKGVNSPRRDDGEQTDLAADPNGQAKVDNERYEELDDEGFERALASQTAKLTPELRKILTGGLNNAEKRKREEEGDARRGIEPANLGVDPLRDGAYGGESDDEADGGQTSGRQHDDGHVEKQEYMASEAYKPNAFGDFRSYMKNKRLKLKVQEMSISEDEVPSAKEGGGAASTSKHPALFTGTNIYINGHTNPPYGELRRLIHLHDGELMPYLDTKSPVTHIIASNLTAKKRIEFKDYRVVRPEWITESIKLARRLDWRDFRCNEDASGAMSMGALGAQAAVGQAEAEREARQRRAELEQARTAAARGDWRATSGSQAGTTTTAHQLRPYAQSGLGAGTEDGVGPWGRASRQKTLGGWARKPPTRAPEELPQPTLAPREVAEDSTQKEQEAQHGVPPPDLQSASDEKDLPSSSTMQTTSPEPALPAIDLSSSEKVHVAAAPHTPKTPSKLRHDATANDQTSTSSYVNVGRDPASKKAAAAGGLYHGSNPYASRPSNSKAAELMASPSWRERNTATSEGFLQGYFGKSRLHHLSTWKSEMREMVAQALREAKREHGSVDLPAGMRRVIFHIDFDAFFVSVGLRSRPELVDKAVVVCHADSDTPGNSSTSEIASCNYVARTFGIRNGMSLGQARRFCPTVQSIPYDFVAYNDIAIRFYTLLLSHADAIEAVSIDEALIDVSFLLQDMRAGAARQAGVDPAREALMSAYIGHRSSQGEQWTEEKQLAEALRDQIRISSGCEASIGIGSNVLLARLATRKAKPGGSFHLRDEDVPDFIDDLQIDDLHGVGWSIRNRCRDLYGTTNVGELKRLSSKGKFVSLFGDKHGVTLWDKLYGKERDALEPIKPRQSCGASINYAIRFKTQEEVRDFVQKLSVEVSNRLKAIGMHGRICCVSLMVRSKDAPVEAPKFLGHGICDTFNRSTALSRLTSDEAIIFQTAWKMIAALHVEPDQMRGVGVSLQKLEYTADGMQAAQKLEAGQSRLSFASARQMPVQDVDQTRAGVDGGADGIDFDDDDDEGLSPPPSPSLEVGRLSNKQASLPISTQFVIPSDAELDRDVLAALPESIRCKILAAQRSTIEQNSSEANIGTTSETTPDKKQKAKVIDTFERMRAASATPTKKRQSSQRGIQSTISSAPSTPSGSQRRPQRVHATWEPSWTQIDPAVLNELPDDVRQEILRQVGQAAGRGVSAVGRAEDIVERAEAAITADVDSAIDALRRSQSISPRKKQAHLDLLGGIRTKHENNLRAVKEGNAQLPPIMANGRAFVPSTTSLPPRPPPLDPASVTSEQLLALEIDPDVFAALPPSVQRETLETMSERKARFRTGRHTAVELTKAQQRLALRRHALPDDEQGKADRLLKARREVNLPSIKGASTADEINDLINKWVRQFTHNGPRDRDTQRFARFLVECIQRTQALGGVTRQGEDMSVRRSTRNRDYGAGTASAVNAPPLDGMEKVHDILCCWSRLLRNIEWQSDETRRMWQSALNGVHEQINGILRHQYGASLSVLGTERLEESATARR